MKKIGVLTSGGDCAGLNAVLRAVMLCAREQYGWEVLGIKNGTAGFMSETPDVIKLDHSLAGFGENLLRMGGTILGTTNRGDPFAYPTDKGLVDMSDVIIRGYHKLGLDGLIGIGGDGSHRILQKLALQGDMKIVGIPKTIDNDIGQTEAIGHITAVNVATQALDQLQPTAASHDRVMILEVMGRDAGHIALASGIAGGADVILIPEIPFHVEKVAQKIRTVRQNGRNFALVVIAESAYSVNDKPRMVKYAFDQERFGGIGEFLSRTLHEATGAETRVTVLGHVQRGGQPVSKDRLLAAAFGVRAVQLIAEGGFGRMVVWKNQTVTDIPIDEAIASYQAVDLDGTLVHTARGLGICLGDA